MGYTGVKYVFKYITKGPDRATTSLTANPEAGADGRSAPDDEITEYIDSIYISAHEAHWRIAEFKTHGNTVPVTILQIHLEGKQTVMLNLDLALEDQTSRNLRGTTLTAFFKWNQQTPSSTLYQDFPGQFAFDQKQRKWSPRRRGFAVGRITFLPVSAGDVYYLRILLINIAGQRSFEDTRIFNGEVLLTYKAACIARGLLGDDSEWDQALTEAGQFQPGRQFRAFFITILTNCEPADPARLWDRHRATLADDCIHLLQNNYRITEPTQDQAEDLALLFLYDDFLTRNHDSRRWQLPYPLHDWTEQRLRGGSRLIQEQRDHNLEAETARSAANRAQMNAHQAIAYNTIAMAVDSGMGGLYFLDGPGGTGKTFVQNTLLAHQRSLGRIALAVATTGIAATLLDGGVTTHSRFKIPVTDLHELDMQHPKAE